MRGGSAVALVVDEATHHGSNLNGSAEGFNYSTADECVCGGGAVVI